MPGTILRPATTTNPMKPMLAVMCTSVLVTAGLAGCGSGGDPPPLLTGAAAEGEQLVGARGCLSCHSTDGSGGSGPTWDGLAGNDVTLSDRRVVRADADYLRRAILEPDIETVEGFPSGLMRAAVHAGSLTRAEVDAIVAYLETLGNQTDGSGD